MSRVVLRLGMGHSHTRRYYVHGGNQVGPSTCHGTLVGAVLSAYWMRLCGYRHIYVEDRAEGGEDRD